MTVSGRRRFFRTLKWTAFGVLALLLALFVLFPGQRLWLAFVIGTGVGRDGLQTRIDAIEEKAIRQQTLTASDRTFLVDFYSTLATGGKVSILVAQTGRMMSHYLEGDGSDFQLEASIFTGNLKVQKQAGLLAERARQAPCEDGRRFSSPVFYMPDKSNWDSVFGLYTGQIHLTEQVTQAGKCVFHWRAEVPWAWPSYASLNAKYGTPHAQSFPLPSVRSLLFGPQYSLFVDDGLGHYLEEIGLAKSFLAFAEWTTE